MKLLVRDYSVSNLVKWGKYSSAEEYFLKKNNLEVPLCKCGEPRKFISVNKGFFWYCDYNKHYDEIVKLSHERRTKTVRSYYNTEGFDEYIEQNIEKYIEKYIVDFPFNDPLDGMKIRNIQTLINKSPSDLKYFDIETNCKICQKDIIYNIFTNKKETCESKSCIRYYNHYPKLTTWIEKYDITIKDFKFIKKHSSNINLESNIVRFIENRDLSEHQLFKFLTNRLLKMDGYILEREYERFPYSYLKNGLLEHVVKRICISCGSEYIYADVLYDDKTNIKSEKKIGAEYTCSKKCFNTARTEHKIFPVSKEHRKKQSMVMKKLVLDGKFTPKSENYRTHKRFRMDGFSFRSSWETYFYIFMKSNGHNIDFEKLRLKYYDPVRKKKRVYIVDFIDDNNNVVYEVKPSKFLDKTSLAKEETLIKWCKENDFKYERITEKWFRENYYSSLILENDVKIENKEVLLNRLKSFERNE